MIEITQETLWFHHNEYNPDLLKWYVQVAATHERSPEVEYLREKYGELTIMEQGYDESSRYGIFTVFGVPLHAYLAIYPEQSNNATIAQKQVIPKLAKKYRRMVE